MDRTLAFQLASWLARFLGACRKYLNWKGLSGGQTGFRNRLVFMARTKKAPNYALLRQLNKCEKERANPVSRVYESDSRQLK